MRQHLSDTIKGWHLTDGKPVLVTVLVPYTQVSNKFDCAGQVR